MGGFLGVLFAAVIVRREGPGAESWSAVAAWLTLLVAIVAAVAAVHQIVEARHQRTTDARAAETQRRLQVDEAQRQRANQAELARALEEERIQPYVVVALEPKSLASGVWAEIVVRNFGQTAAYNVVLSFDAPGPQTSIGLNHAPRSLRIPRSFPVLAPGQEWRTLWLKVVRDHLDDQVTLPDPVVGTVQFERHGGRPPIGGPFVYELDPRSLVHTRVVEYSVHELVKEFREFREDLGLQRPHRTDSRFRDRSPLARSQTAPTADADDEGDRAGVRGEDPSGRETKTSRDASSLDGALRYRDRGFPWPLPQEDAETSAPETDLGEHSDSGR